MPFKYLSHEIVSIIFIGFKTLFCNQASFIIRINQIAQVYAKNKFYPFQSACERVKKKKKR